jgi:S1-C subfamily serine protease
VAETDPNLLQRVGMQVESGVLVSEILKTSLALKAGLAVGDVVTAVNGQPVEQPSDVDFVNWTLFIGDPVIFEVDRQGQRKVIKTAVEEVPR